MLEIDNWYGDNPLVKDCLRAWLRWEVERDYSISTFERYFDISERLLIPLVGEMPIQDLTPRHVRALHQELLAKNLSPRSVGIAHTVLGGAVKHAVQLEIIEKNPLVGAPPPRTVDKEIVPPDVSAVQRILEIAEREEHRLFSFVHLLVYTGLRRGEAMALRWQNVLLDEGYIRVVESAVKSRGHGTVIKRPKTVRGVRTVDLDDRTVSVLKDHHLRLISAGYQGDLVFPHHDGTHLKVTTIVRDLKDLGQRVGAPGINFHSLRHFHASVALQQKQNVVVVSRRLGHASVVTTLDTYAHVMPGWQKGVADAFAQAMEAGD